MIKSDLPNTPIKKIKTWSYAGLHIVSGIYDDNSKKYIAVSCKSGHVLIYRTYYWTLIRAIEVFKNSEEIIQISWAPDSNSIFCIGEHGSYAWIDVSRDVPYMFDKKDKYPLRIYSSLPNKKIEDGTIPKIYPIPSVLDETNRDLMKAIEKNPNMFTYEYIPTFNNKDKKQGAYTYYGTIHNVNDKKSGLLHNGNIKNEDDNPNINSNNTEKTKNVKTDVNKGMLYVNTNKEAVDEYNRKSKMLFILEGQLEGYSDLDTDIHFINNDEVLVVISSYSPDMCTKVFYANKSSNDENMSEDNAISKNYSNDVNNNKETRVSDKKTKSKETSKKKYWNGNLVICDLPLPSNLSGDVFCNIKRFDNYSKDPNVFEVILSFRGYLISYEFNIKNKEVAIVGISKIDKDNENDSRIQYKFIKGSFNATITLTNEKKVYLFLEGHADYTKLVRSFDKISTSKDNQFLSVLKPMNKDEKVIDASEIGKYIDKDGKLNYVELLYSPNAISINGISGPFSSMAFSSSGEHIIVTKPKTISIFDIGIRMKNSYSMKSGEYENVTLMQESSLENSKHKKIYSNYLNDPLGRMKGKYPSIMFCARKGKGSIIIYSQYIPQLYSGLIKDFEEMDKCKPIIEREDEHDYSPDRELYSEEMFEKSHIFKKYIGDGLDDLRERILERVSKIGFYQVPEAGKIEGGPILPFNEHKQDDDDEKLDTEHATKNISNCAETNNNLSVLPAQLREPERLTCSNKWW